MTKRRLRPWVVILFSVICFIGVIYCSYKIISWIVQVNENKKIQDNIDNKIKEVEIDENGQTVYDIDFESLKKQNSDIIAYIKVNNTNISYVVVKGNDNEYYLKHNLEKKWNIAGWIFGDYHNKFDETDRNLIIYGHNTQDGSMFGTLKNTLNKDWYLDKENYEVILVTEKGTYHYKIFSTYSIEPEDYYINTVFENNEEFDEFVKVLKSRSVYDYGVEVTGEDKIITLSSCMNEGKLRVVLHARLIENNEEERDT